MFHQILNASLLQRFIASLFWLCGEIFLLGLLIIATVTVTKVLEGSWRDLSTFLQKRSRLQTVAAVGRLYKLLKLSAC